MGTGFGPTFGTGDVVGAGLHAASNDVFFTKNGKWLGHAFRDVCVNPLFPTVCLHSKDERVSANFGATAFCFDIHAYIDGGNYERTVAVAAEDLPPSATHELVRDYLAFHGYAKTLAALDDGAAASSYRDERRGETTANALADDDDNNDNDGVGADDPMASDACAADFSDLRQRACIHSLILDGNMDAAEEHLRATYPGVFKSDYAAEVCLHLKCQRYVEMIRAGRISDALEYAQSTMTACVGLEPSWDEVVRGVMALVAYELPEKSPLASFLSPEHRDRVADAVNSAILATTHFEKRAASQPSSGSILYVGGVDAGMAVSERAAGESGGGLSVRSTNSTEGNEDDCEIPVTGVPTMAAVLGLGSRAELLMRQLCVSAQELRVANGGNGEVFKIVKGR